MTITVKAMHAPKAMAKTQMPPEKIMAVTSQPTCLNPLAKITHATKPSQSQRAARLAFNKIGGAAIARLFIV